MSTEILGLLELELDDNELMLSLLRDFAELIEMGCVGLMVAVFCNSLSGTGSPKENSNFHNLFESMEGEESEEECGRVIV